MRTRPVLVHGTRVSHVQGSAHRRWLEPRFDVVLPDLPGHGARAAQPFTMDSAVEVVGQAVEGGPPGQPVVLVGHLLGGYVAMTYAAAHPDRLAGLVLIGSTAVPGGVGGTAYRFFGWATERAGSQRMTRFNDWLLSRMAPSEVYTATQQQGYWFEGCTPPGPRCRPAGDPSCCARCAAPCSSSAVSSTRSASTPTGMPGRRATRGWSPSGVRVICCR
ncbi:MAG: alpha/beta fold hydrolase [Dermatophilaceae bacterium]